MNLTRLEARRACSQLLSTQTTTSIAMPHQTSEGRSSEREVEDGQWVHSYIDEKANTTLNKRENIYLITENEIRKWGLKNVMIAYELMDTGYSKPQSRRLTTYQLDPNAETEGAYLG